MAANGPLSQLWAGTWGVKNKDLSSRGYSEGATSEEGPSSLHMGTVFLFSSRSSYCTCLVAPVFPHGQLCTTPAAPTSHTWRSCHSQAVTPPLAPRSEPVPDFPVLLLERLVQEHVEEQAAAPPGDSRSH